MRVAMRRAAHQIFDRPQRVGRSLWRWRSSGPKQRHSSRTRSGGTGNASGEAFARSWRLRSRFAEDQLALAVARGARQYVILGAGLDTFAYRNPYPEKRSAFSKLITRPHKNGSANN